MTRPSIQAERVDACKQGDEARARELVSRLAAQPLEARRQLEAMLSEPDALVRQAAAFGLGVLGGTTSVRRLEQQLVIEEARGDHDGESVVEAITDALGRIEEASARAGLVRRLERLVAGKPDPGDVSTLARKLWRRRHPELLPVVRSSLEKLPAQSTRTLRGLLLLLEKSPGELEVWARDPSGPLEQKLGVVLLLEEDLPEALIPTLPSFCSAACALVEAAVRQEGEASKYCNRLFSLLILNRERVLPTLPEESRSELRPLTRRLIAARSPDASLRAAVLLESIGLPEDARLLEAHRPAEPVLAQVFDEAARRLRGRPQA